MRRKCHDDFPRIKLEIRKAPPSPEQARAWNQLWDLLLYGIKPDAVGKGEGRSNEDKERRDFWKTVKELRCERCGFTSSSKKDFVAHHESYEPPKMRLLCHPCHTDVHNETQNGVEF